MSDLRQQRDIARRLEQTQVVERPGASGQNTFSATGTWTPFFEGTTGAGTYTYVTQTGRYMRVGNRVHFEFDINISAIAVAPTGNMIITGLPILSGAAVSFGPCYLGFKSNIILPAGKTEITALVPPGGLNRINLYTFQTNAGGALYPAASFTNVNCQLIGGGHYEV
jgi:hypothetical protein